MRYRAIVGVLAATVASAALAAYGRPHWSFLEFVEETQVGRVNVRLAVGTKQDPTRLTRLEIRVHGRRLKIPRAIASFAIDPHLDKVSLRRLGSVTCVDEHDCKLNYPVELHIPYGKHYYRDADKEDCETSDLVINFQAKYVESVSYYICNEIDDGQWQDLYERPAA